MRSTFSVLFFVKKDKQKANGNYPIWCRITMDKLPVTFNLRTDVKPELWNAKTGKAEGRTMEATQINNYLDLVHGRLFSIYQGLQLTGKCSAEEVKNEFLGRKKEVVDEREPYEKYLVKLFEKNNENYEKLVGHSIIQKTYGRYVQTLSLLKFFMQSEYSKTDMLLEEITPMFVSDFKVYLISTGKYKNNTVSKHMQRFKKIITTAKDNGYITTNPFAGFEMQWEESDRCYLTEEEVMRLIEKQFATKRLEEVRDMFIFSCYTGLAYCDVKALTEYNIRKSFDGKFWIMINRQKTSTAASIPLFKIPELIIEKYKGKVDNGCLLPIKSNQKMNEYLHEIAILCGINKKLTTHVARHTFATTITLANGVPMESVSKMLGHSKIETTEIYAKITNSKISRDCQHLQSHFETAEMKFTEMNN